MFLAVSPEVCLQSLMDNLEAFDSWFLISFFFFLTSNRTFSSSILCYEIVNSNENWKWENKIAEISIQ